MSLVSVDTQCRGSKPVPSTMSTEASDVRFDFDSNKIIHLCEQFSQKTEMY